MTAAPPATPIPSATLVLLRDGGEGLEVFMVRRHHRIDFAGGAMVFPGGQDRRRDGDASVRTHCAGIAGLTDDAVAARVAAIRESFEEGGLLLARAKGQAALLGGARVAALGDRYRAPITAGAASMADFASAEALEFACDALVPFAHWITPAFLPKRFDTHFFLAAAPDGQVAVHDGGESVASLWIAPRRAVAEAGSGIHKLMFATHMNLGRLAAFERVEEALAAARATPVVTVTPARVRTREGPRMCIPAGAGYGAVAGLAVLD